MPVKGLSFWPTCARYSGSSTCRPFWCIRRERTPRGEAAAGQGLRGSDDIHAFGDSNLNLRRSREHLVLSSEHRAATAATSVTLELVTTDAQTTHLEVIGELRDGPTKLTMEDKRRGLEERVLDLLSQGVTVTRAKLRDSLGVKNERLGEALKSLERAGFVARPLVGNAWVDRRWRAVPVPHKELRGNGTVLLSPSRRVTECGSTSLPPEEQSCRA